VKSYTIEAVTYGVDLTEDEYETLEFLFDDVDCWHWFSEDVVVIARDDEGTIIGGITESGGDGLTIAVASDSQNSGIGTAMVKAFLEAGGCGYMVAGTEAGSSFLFSLPNRLGYFPEELDVPCWTELQELESEE